MTDQEYLVHRARAAGVRDRRVLDALGRIKRPWFVAAEFRGKAYDDEPIPIQAGQVTSQPSLIAKMVEALALAGGERVLEVGTGSGYQTALLAELAAEVVSIERSEEIAVSARANLAGAGVDGVRIVVGDGSEGVADAAPFDAIVVSAASPEVPGPLAEQLAEGGRLVIPLGPGGREQVAVFRKLEGALQRVGTVAPARFVRLVGSHAHPDRDDP